MRKGNAVFYLHGDHLGSTSLTTDSSGKVVQEARYLPYGELRWSNSGQVTDIGFTGQRHETAFGLMDFNARYYNPRVGMFISPDTIVPDPTQGHTYNRYLYVGGNPMRYTDLTGHFSEEQLNYLGIHEDQVNAQVWNLLLFLEPEDLLYPVTPVMAPPGAEGITGQVVIGSTQMLGQNGQYALGILDGGSSVIGSAGAVAWLNQHYADGNVSVIRRFADGTQGTVWENGAASAWWQARVDNVEAKLQVADKKSATLTSFYNGVCSGGMGSTTGGMFSVFIGSYFGAGEAAPGTVTGDMEMTFVYHLHSEASKPSDEAMRLARVYQFRKGTANTLMVNEEYGIMVRTEMPIYNDGAHELPSMR
jgi:RHS repeat-associated protein